MHYKINKDLIVTDYDQACEMIEFGCIEVYENEILIDEIDFETAKQGVANSAYRDMYLKKLIKG